MIDHLVCTRHQEHKIAHQWWADHVIPTREVGKTLQPNLADLPILALRGGVGATAWALPFINIIDLHGLNDRVIGRTPTDPAQTRRMAHSRRPPPGYVEAFAPNVRLGPLKRVVIERREEAMTNERIQAIEKHWQMP